MIALELSVNGTVVRRVGVGEFGRLDSMVRHHRVRIPDRQDHVQLYLQTSGQDGETEELVIWEDVPLAHGDVVTIRVVDDETFPTDPPSERVPSQCLPPSMR